MDEATEASTPVHQIKAGRRKQTTSTFRFSQCNLRKDTSRVLAQVKKMLESAELPELVRLKIAKTFKSLFEKVSRKAP